MSFKLGRNNMNHAQEDGQKIINGEYEQKVKDLLTDKEVLEYFSPYADLSIIQTQSGYDIVAEERVPERVPELVQFDLFLLGASGH